MRTTGCRNLFARSSEAKEGGGRKDSATLTWCHDIKRKGLQSATGMQTSKEGYIEGSIEGSSGIFKSNGDTKSTVPS